MAQDRKTSKEKYDLQWLRTAENKIKAIEKALLTAGEKQKAFLNERIEFWKSGIHKQKTHR